MAAYEYRDHNWETNQEEKRELRQEALKLFSRCSEFDTEWTPRKELEIMMAHPIEIAGYFQKEIDSMKTLAHTLTQCQPMEIREETIDGDLHLVFSGPGAARLALLLRDELGKNFRGSSSIPEPRELG